jgi:hypothetical protein
MRLQMARASRHRVLSQRAEPSVLQRVLTEQLPAQRVLVRVLD